MHEPTVYFSSPVSKPKDVATVWLYVKAEEEANEEIFMTLAELKVKYFRDACHVTALFIFLNTHDYKVN